jgi:hypothetical protein
LELVDDPQGQGELRTDHGQVHLQLFGEIGELDDVGDADRHTIGDRGDPGVARGGVQLAHQGGLLELPAEGMLARTLADHEDSHVPEIVAVVACRAGLPACLGVGGQARRPALHPGSAKAA